MRAYTAYGKKTIPNELGVSTFNLAAILNLC
jgi:hypothetical protein